ncbi:ABC transporter permease subunit [Geotoga petraea]|uniref:ABC-2 type transport system permease protein n=1 Tax=Geotoga petraea TaxID=28234 RepID=A0A1G6KUT2_9BACT|nr:ABC transporter permease subunit [Geotoga petraea]SDC34734.1 ABC-2 type transport system permease protein [Geotoga petraea]
MNFNLLKKEIKFTYKSSILWTLLFVLFTSMYIPISNQLLSQSGDLLKFINNMPRFLLESFNFNEQVFTKPEGIFGSEGMSFVYILGAVFATMLISNVFAREYEKGTIEYLCVKPISRSTLYITKFINIIINILFLNIIFTISVVSMYAIFMEYEYNPEILIGFGIYSFTVQIFFSSLSVIISILTQNSSSNMGFSFAILIFMSFGDTMANIIDATSWIKYFSIFHYIPLTETVLEEKIFWINSIIIILISLGIYYFSYYLFKNKDINI